MMLYGGWWGTNGADVLAMDMARAYYSSSGEQRTREYQPKTEKDRTISLRTARVEVGP